jgi:Ca-activated chloride channel homolog
MSVALSAAQAGLLFAAASLVLVLWFFLRRRAQRREVPSLAFFRLALAERVRPLWRELLALALQILAVGLLAASLRAPEPGGVVTPTERPIAIIIDASRSMGTSGRLEAARAIASAMDAAIILGSDGPLLLTAPRPSATERERALTRITANAPRADLAAAVRLARSLGADPIVLSDEPRDDLDAVTRVVGPAAEDVGIDSLSVAAGPGLPARVLIAVTATDHGAPTKRRLTLRTDAGIVGDLELELGAGETTRKVVSIRPVPGTWIEATLEGADDYPDNDRAVAILPTVTPARIAVVGPPNRYLDAALAVLPDLEVRRFAPGREGAIEADLVIFDRATPRAALTVPSLHFAPPGGWTTTETVEHPRVLRWSLDHPIFEGVPLRALQIQSATVLAVPPGGTVLARTAEGPIVVSDDRLPGAVVFGFDLLRSDLPLSAAFPELLYQALVWARSRTMAPLADPVSDGSPVELAGDAPTIIERLDAPGATVALRQTRLPVGVYRLTEPSGSRLLAVGPDPSEHGSPIAGEAPSATAPVPAAAPGHPSLLALAAVIVLFAELFVAPL